jgi:lysophospholipase L1-like esterase
MIQEVAKETMSTFIPTQDLFNNATRMREPAFWSYDGIHPTHAGFQLLAHAWIDAFESMKF